jgi:hypothetical protein
MQKPCKVRENENACRTRPWLEGCKQERRQGVKKDDTVEKRVTGGGRYKVQGIRYKEEEKPRFEFGCAKIQHAIKGRGKNKREQANVQRSFASDRGA